MVGLDAADFLLVERWAREGRLPNLAALMASGTRGRLRSSARLLAGSPWPTFFTGRSPAEHGLYHDFQWRQERMGFAAPSPDWLPTTPFWRRLDADLRVVTYDVPFLLDLDGAAGREVIGFAGHDRLTAPMTHPPELLRQIEAEFGGLEMIREGYGVRTPGELLALRDFLVEITRRSTRVAVRLLEEPWDLAVLGFGATHRAGHRLWDRSSADRPLSGEEGARFDRALEDVYAECDRTIGALVECAPDARVLVFALHGMMVNACRNDMLDAMLARALEGPEARTPRPGLIRRLGEALPLALRRAASRAVPGPLRDGIVTRWATGGRDWSRTQAFTLRADLQGYIRINLRGREPEGIVPADALDGLCERISEGLASFRDATSGEPVVAEVVRLREVWGDGERMDRLPDLIVRWVDTPAKVHEALASDRLGRIERETPGRIPNGRSGNHRGEGFLVASGPGIPSDAALEAPGDIRDLAPTVLELLGHPALEGLEGRPLTLARAPTG